MSCSLTETKAGKETWQESCEVTHSIQHMLRTSKSTPETQQTYLLWLVHITGSLSDILSFWKAYRGVYNYCVTVHKLAKQRCSIYNIILLQRLNDTLQLIGHDESTSKTLWLEPDLHTEGEYIPFFLRQKCQYFHKKKNYACKADLIGPML